MNSSGQGQPTWFLQAQSLILTLIIFQPFPWPSLEHTALQIPRSSKCLREVVVPIRGTVRKQIYPEVVSGLGEQDI